MWRPLKATAVPASFSFPFSVEFPIKSRRALHPAAFPCLYPDTKSRQQTLPAFSHLYLLAHHLKDDVARTVACVALHECQVLPRAKRNLALDEGDHNKR